MAFIPAWRNFKRMQDLTVTAAGLIYAAAAVRAFGRFPGGLETTLRWTLLWPAAYLGFSLAIPLGVAPLRRWLAKYVWLSFKAGFGQTPASVVVGMGLLLGAGLFIHEEVVRAARAGQAGANVFAAYAAGIGILAAQAILVRTLEQLPDIRAKIVERGG
ncbi:MAG TPA: hypothetical protein VFE18_09460 [Phenylobacterium sp.]|jgi:hypothetical protein|uniref:hypothetical protein n=1 Tax=Phenylobacterium sp. TaxID=1871053 RepID=UPI002D72E5C2|nr:hypothetical protein [Phenylobacterium sp.]HZZ68389.1 hypothetical protein [Phenylobacterium sp.]